METKTKRQLEIVQKWISNNCLGGIVCPTGFGKTRTAILCIKYLNTEMKALKTIVVVPTIVLKSQWEEELKIQEAKADVYVINTASKTKLKCDLLILDEAHTAPALTFREIFNTIEYTNLFWMTATLKRSDGNENIILDKAPVIDSITLEECLENKWVSEHTVYNLSVPFNIKDDLAYKKADKEFRYYASLIGGNNTFDVAKRFLQSKINSDKQLGLGYFRSLKKRKEIIVNNENKLQICLDIINKFSTFKAIIFSESIKFADKVSSLLGDKCVSVHSKLTKKKQSEALALFKEWDTGTIASVKGLIAGLDDPKLSLGLRPSFNSSALLNKQSIGRVIRAQKDKQALFINLYTPDTQEVSWLNRSQEGQKNIIWVDSIDKIK